MAAPVSLSLERKLPLLISVLLAALAVGLTAAGYHEVKQGSEARGIARLQRLTSQLAELSGTTTQQRLATLDGDDLTLATVPDAKGNFFSIRWRRAAKMP